MPPPSQPGEAGSQPTFVSFENTDLQKFAALCKETDHSLKEGVSLPPLKERVSLLVQSLGGPTVLVGRFAAAVVPLVFLAVGNHRVLGCLLDMGADVNIQRLGDGMTLLQRAIEGDSVGSVALLLERGADPAMCNKGGEHAFHTVAKSRDQAKLDLLCQHYEKQGAEGTKKRGELLNQPCAGHLGGRTPLHAALVDQVGITSTKPKATWKFVDALLIAGAKPDVIDGSGRNAVQFATLHADPAVSQGLRKLCRGLESKLLDLNPFKTVEKGQPNPLLTTNHGEALPALPTSHQAGRPPLPPGRTINPNERAVVPAGYLVWLPSHPPMAVGGALPPPFHGVRLPRAPSRQR